MKYRKETLEELDLTVRTYNCLKRAGINTVTDLTTRSLFGLAEIKGMNTFSHNEIEGKLKELGLKLRPSNSVRACPHNWPDCSICVYVQACNDGTYIPEPEPMPAPEPATTELTEPELSTDLSIPIPSERGTWVSQFLAMTEEQRWVEQKRYIRPDDLISKEPTTCMGGPVVPGGSKSGRIKKSNKGTKIPIEPWTSNV